MKVILKIICFVIIFSCSKSSKNKIPNPALISWESELVMEDGEHTTDYYKNRKSFIKPFIKHIYIGNDTLLVETLHEINSCGNTVGEIKFSSDTLFLSTKLISEETCASVEFHRFKYMVVKNKIESFIIEY